VRLDEILGSNFLVEVVAINVGPREAALELCRQILEAIAEEDAAS
jgi:hypothetical protein